MNAGFEVTCKECNKALHEVETIYNGGITLHLCICPVCGCGTTLVTNTLYENGNEVFGRYVELHT